MTICFLAKANFGKRGRNHFWSERANMVSCIVENRLAGVLKGLATGL
jgi:hypothetical protein